MHLQRNNSDDFRSIKGWRMNRLGHSQSQEDLIGMRGGVPGMGGEFASRPSGGISHQGYWRIKRPQILIFQRPAYHVLQPTPTYTQSETTTTFTPSRRGAQNESFGSSVEPGGPYWNAEGCPRDWKEMRVTSSRRYFSSGILEDQKASCSPKSSYSEACMSRFCNLLLLTRNRRTPFQEFASCWKATPSVYSVLFYFLNSMKCARAPCSWFNDA
ncbi:hypothetical protein CEXT_62111 [Caerostris extrusa]|uniref:Uncharacterized protein n=1 Tax=Caerostris extrusa TaxID=172846 RepID=A0AAV4RCL0_CAEEX|nr:hypothetical protein CEXT_62111 [Caerostris extrusa]